MARNKQKKMTKYIAIGIALIFILTSISTVIRMLALSFSKSVYKDWLFWLEGIYILSVLWIKYKFQLLNGATDEVVGDMSEANFYEQSEF